MTRPPLARRRTRPSMLPPTFWRDMALLLAVLAVMVFGAAVNG